MKKYNLCVMIILVLLGISGNINAQDNILDQKQEKIVIISAFAAKGKLDKLKTELNAGLDAGLTVNEVKEVLVHIYAYSGFPRSLRGLQTLITVLDERKAKGINDNWGRETTPITDTRDKYERGKEILTELTGVKVEGRPQTGYAAFSPEIETFLKEHLFADIFVRDVLTYSQREMVTVSVLISIGGVEPMLNSHMNLCLNVGITPDQLQQVLSIIEKYVSEEDTGSARQILADILKNRNLN